MTIDTETQRNADFRTLPGFADYLVTMLQDLQYAEMDEACSEDRDERDTGTIYTLPAETYDRCKRDYVAFVAAAGPDALGFIADQGAEMFGSDFYMTRVGHGVGYWDRGAGEVGDRLTALVGHGTAFPSIDAYFGDDRAVYLV